MITRDQFDAHIKDNNCYPIGNRNYMTMHDIDLTNIASADKVWSMIQALETGEELPPLYREGNVMLSGMHRLAASEIRAQLNEADCGYDDLNIIDISPMLDCLTIEQKEWWEMISSENTEFAASLLDDANNSIDDFKSMINENL